MRGRAAGSRPDRSITGAATGRDRGPRARRPAKPGGGLGAEVSVPSVASHMSMEIPAGTQSGYVFHLRGRGLPRVNAAGTGDLHVRVQLWTPDRVTDEERQLLGRLAELQPGIPADGR